MWRVGTGSYGQFTMVPMMAILISVLWRGGVRGAHGVVVAGRRVGVGGHGGGGGMFD